MAREFYIYFSDLIPETQQSLLNFVGAESPSENNWDCDAAPIAVYSRADEFENYGGEESTSSNVDEQGEYG